MDLRHIELVELVELVEAANVAWLRDKRALGISADPEDAVRDLYQIAYMRGVAYGHKRWESKPTQRTP